MSDPREEPAQPSASSRIWFVRAGVRGADVGSFFAEGFVGIAWDGTGALTGLVDLSASEERLAATYPTRSWSIKATDEAFARGAVKLRSRPRVTHYCGATKTAVGGH